MKIKLTQLETLVKAGFKPKIQTPTGLETITDTYRKSGDGVYILFSDNTHIKASNYHQVLVDNEWICCKDLRRGDSICFNNESKVISCILYIIIQVSH